MEVITRGAPFSHRTHLLARDHFRAQRNQDRFHVKKDVSHPSPAVVDGQSAQSAGTAAARTRHYTRHDAIHWRVDWCSESRRVIDSRVLGVVCRIGAVVSVHAVDGAVPLSQGATGSHKPGAQLVVLGGVDGAGLSLRAADNHRSSTGDKKTEKASIHSPSPFKNSRDEIAPEDRRGLRLSPLE